MSSRASVRGLCVAVLLGWGATAWGSDIGYEVADQVTQTSYQHYLADLLYTHDGNNRDALSGPNKASARSNIVTTLGALGLNVEVESFSYLGVTCHNVIATQLGTVHPDAYHVIGAHYDSAANPGADDNASGVAGVLEIARILSAYDSEYTIKYIAFDAEEYGLIGSEVYVYNHYYDDIRGMISMDMIAWNTGSNRAEAYGFSSCTAIKNALKTAISAYGQGLATQLFTESYSRSDHGPFQEAGFQACLLIEDNPENNPCYHTACDSVDNAGYLNYAFAVKMTRSVAGYLADNAVVIPNPASQLGSCCMGTSCTLTTQVNCTGTWTSGGRCSPDNPCQTGSCCVGLSCTVTTQANCAGTWMSEGTCSPNPCQTGSCCVGTTCTVTTQANCAGTWTSGGTCSPTNPCQTGSCCMDTSCSVTTEANCAGMWTSGGVCSPVNPCQTGSCCVGTTCTVTTQVSCAGTWSSGGTCGPTNPCQTGSCCVGLSCTVTAQANCAGTWISGASCSPNPCSVGLNGPFALAYGTNGSGTVSVDPPGGLYAKGAIVRLQAVPAATWRFVEWTGDVQGADSNISVVMDGPRIVIARFEKSDAPPSGTPTVGLCGLSAAEAGLCTLLVFLLGPPVARGVLRRPPRRS